MEQESVKCRDCSGFGHNGAAAMRTHGFGSCDVLTKQHAAAPAIANASYKSAEYERKCETFTPKKVEGEGQK